MTLGDWDQNIATRSTEELERNQQSLIDLQRWQTFEAEFKWTSMFTLLISIEAELRQRNTDSNRIEHTFHPHIFADCPACQAALVILQNERARRDVVVVEGGVK